MGTPIFGTQYVLDFTPEGEEHPNVIDRFVKQEHFCDTHCVWINHHPDCALAQPEPFNPDWDRVKALEESLREHMAEIQRLKALAQPEQLVVGGDDLPTLTKWAPQRQPLTDEEIYKLFGWYAVPFVRAVEKAHGIE